MSKIGISELAKVLIDKHGLSQKDAEGFVSTVFQTLNDCLETDKLVKLKGLGTFKITTMNARESVDVNTGERIMIDSRDKISFVPDTIMRDLVNRPFAQFDTVVVNDGVDLSIVDDEQREEIVEVEESVVPEREQIAEETVAEVPRAVVADEPQIVPDTPPTDDETGARERKGRMDKVVVTIVACVVVVALVGVMHYIHQRQKQRVQAETNDIVVEKRAKPAREIKPLAPQPVDSGALYNKDARIRTGAYDIVGIADTVRVRPGQTLESISKSFLGDGMECYVEAVNGGKTSVAAGDTVKIPVLKLKKHGER